MEKAAFLSSALGDTLPRYDTL